MDLLMLSISIWFCDDWIKRVNNAVIIILFGRFNNLLTNWRVSAFDNWSAKYLNLIALVSDMVWRWKDEKLQKPWHVKHWKNHVKVWIYHKVKHWILQKKQCKTLNKIIKKYISNQILIKKQRIKI